MKESVLEILRCPVLKTDLQLVVFTSEKLIDGIGKSYVDINEGLLINKDNTAYPIIDGVPRLIEGALSFNRNFSKKWTDEIKKLGIKEQHTSENFKKFILPTLTRFEQEWEKHDLNKRTWGLQQQERIEHFLLCMGFTQEEMPGKLILDLQDNLPLLPFIKTKRLSVSYQKLRKVTPKLSPKFLYILLFFYASYFQLAFKINEIIRGKKHIQSIKERTTSLFDSLAPPYAWKHDINEVIVWFKDSGFNDIKDTTLTMDQAIGMHIRGKKIYGIKHSIRQQSPHLPAL